MSATGGYGVTLEDVRRARRRIAGLAVETPLVPSPALSGRLGIEVRLKLETAQPTGAFKLRGAANAILALPEAERRRGVVAQSSGNHGRAVAWVARALGVPAVVFVPASVPAGKIERIRELGADLVATPGGHRDSIRRAVAYAAARRMTFVPPFDHPQVIAGQGTVALELLEQWPEMDAVVVPLSGGGLLSGIALVVRALAPEVDLTGVSMAGGAAMIASVAAGEMVAVEETPTLADALAGELPLDNRYTFAICRDLVDRLETVEEEEIRRALRWTLHREEMTVEGGAAVVFAWMLAGRRPPTRRRVALVVSGGNIERGRLQELIAEGAPPARPW